MITLVTGTPGSGKTYYTCRLIAESVMTGHFVATNVELVDDWPERIARSHWGLRLNPWRRRRLCSEWRRRLVKVETLGELARVRLSTKGFEKKLEGRGKAIFDEAGEELDSRDWNDRERKDQRKADNRFMRQHRKLGWDVYLIAQEAEQIDTRTRGMCEYETQLRNLKRFRVCRWLAGGFPLWPTNLFVAVTVWKAINVKHVSKREWFTLSRSIASIYNTHQMVHEVSDGDVLWLPLPEPEPTEQDGPPAPDGRPASEAPADVRQEHDLVADVVTVNGSANGSAFHQGSA